jgi:hypothetical protein
MWEAGRPDSCRTTLSASSSYCDLNDNPNQSAHPTTKAKKVLLSMLTRLGYFQVNPIAPDHQRTEN